MFFRFVHSDVVRIRCNLPSTSPISSGTKVFTPSFVKCCRLKYQKKYDKAQPEV